METRITPGQILFGNKYKSHALHTGKDGLTLDLRFNHLSAEERAAVATTALDAFAAVAVRSADFGGGPYTATHYFRMRGSDRSAVTDGIYNEVGLVFQFPSAGRAGGAESMRGEVEDVVTGLRRKQDLCPNGSTI